jgi:type I restriction enzyme M protein
MARSARFYGQEKNITTYNLARMNMLLHGVKDTEFEIFHGDTLPTSGTCCAS